MKLMPSFTSISSKLIRMNLLVSGVALLLACIAFFSYDLISFQQSLIRTLTAEARVVASNSVSALLFNDRETAQSTLAALSSSSDILNAAIVTNDGKMFAEYRRAGAPAVQFPGLRRGVNQRNWVSGTHVLLAYRILFQGNSEGIVYISATLQEMGKRARRYIAIAAGILILCLFAAMLLGAVFRRTVAQPIASLAELSRSVSHNRNYSLRARPPRNYDEVSMLIESFNEMLAQIEQGDSALQQARDELEERVQERTAALKAANHELEAFSYTVAHDLRGPLDAIGGIGYILQQKCADAIDAEGMEMLDKLRSSSAKMASLIDDLLNLSRSGTSSLTRTQVDLSALATVIVEELKATEPGRNITAAIAPGALVSADAGLMRIALENLLRNAWKYTSNRTDAWMEFGFRREGSKLVCFVRDNGAGFNPDFAHRLFEPFQRLHSQAEFSGTGIGLATVKRIVSRHGGRVWAEGALGQGATFYFEMDA